MWIMQSPARTVAPLVLAVCAAIVGACTTSAGTPPGVLPTGQATTATEPRLVFVAKDLRIDVGQCTAVQWESDGMFQAYLDGRGVDTTGSEKVCPTDTTTYTLKAVTHAGTELERTVRIDVVGPTVTATAPPSPTLAPATRAPQPLASPTAPATPTSAATAAVQVDFYCNNRSCDIAGDDLCSAVIWETSGVTNVSLEKDGGGRTPVGASGRQEVCFTQESVTFTLYYKLPNGTEEKRELRIKRKG